MQEEVQHPRHAGLEDGRIIGTIGGGCMESEVRIFVCECFMKRVHRADSVDMTASQAEEKDSKGRYDPGIYGSNMISENCFMLCMPMILSGIRK
ncbi:MAG: XdhC family protein [Blautia obeum]